MTDKTNHDETMDMLTAAGEERAASSTELHALHRRVTSVEDALASNTKLTQSVGDDTRELLELFIAAKGGFKVMGWLGEGLKWLGIVATALAAIWAATHSGRGS